MVMGSEVTMQRQQLVDEALETDCTHILWIDSDTPPYTLVHTDKDIIACNYSTRQSSDRSIYET